MLDNLTLIRDEQMLLLSNASNLFCVFTQSLYIFLPDVCGRIAYAQIRLEDMSN